MVPESPPLVGEIVKFSSPEWTAAYHRKEGGGDGAQDGSAEPEFSMMSSYGSSGSGGGDAASSKSRNATTGVPWP
ncbi:MAG: hypothetical protein EA424_27755, partial [Planctomycetaceae bacterium]